MTKLSALPHSYLYSQHSAWDIWGRCFLRNKIKQERATHLINRKSGSVCASAISGAKSVQLQLPQAFEPEIRLLACPWSDQAPRAQ